MNKCLFQLESPNDMEFTLSVTLKLRDWKRLVEDMKADYYPANQVALAVRTLVHVAEDKFAYMIDANDPYPEQKDGRE
jgi:hypothetical protein